MTDQEKIVKLKEIQANFIKKLKAIEEDRDNKIKAIKKGIDQRKIDDILLKLKS